MKTKLPDLKVDSYRFYLRNYIQRHPDKNESDFLISRIALFENEIDDLKNFYPPKISQKKVKLVLKSSNPNKEERMITMDSQELVQKIKNYIYQLESLLLDYKLRLKNCPIPKKRAVQDIEKRNWFKVGLLFATGEMDLLFEKYGDASKIARSVFGVHWGGFRPFISSSLGKDYEVKCPKNIYANHKKMGSIIDHCNKHSIEITDEFNQKYQLIKPDL